MGDRSTATSRREFLRQSAAMALVGMGAGMLGCEHQPDDPPGVTTLAFFNYADPEFLALFRNKMIPGFEKTHPNIRIRPNENLGDANYDAKLLTLIAGKLPPDLFHVTQNNFPSYVTKDLLLPLDEFIDKDPDIKREDFYPQLMEGMTFEGKLYGLPSDFSTIIMFYNKDLFDQYKVAYPKPDWTWDDYVKTSQALTHDQDGDGRPDVYGTLVQTAYNRWPAFVWMNGGEIFSPDMKRCTMDSPASIEGLKKYLELVTKYRVSPRNDERMGQGAEDLFAAQRIAMQADSRYGYKRMRRDGGVPFKWDVCPMPRAKNQATTFIWGGNCILKSTKHPKEAWEFLKFMSGPQGAAINLESGNALPAHRKSAEFAVANSQSDPKIPRGDRYFLEAVNYARIAPNPPQYADYMDAMDELEDAFQGRGDIEQGCRAFTREVNQLLNAGVF
jgi:multiple sugar transport system substrate-binding protein